MWYFGLFKTIVVLLVQICCVKYVFAQDISTVEDSVLNKWAENMHAELRAVHPANLLETYIDSVKAFDSTQVLPTFLRDPYLDVKYGQISFHRAISLRAILIDSTESVQLLTQIVNSEDGIFKELANQEKSKGLPMAGISTYELARRKLCALRPSKCE